MSKNIDNIDLENIGYDDILHLYKNLKKSEQLIKDKNKELNEFKDRIKQLEESHYTFRSQIKAFESVKELTITLQSEINILKQENLILLKENKELNDLNEQAEEILINHINKEKKTNDLYNNINDKYNILNNQYNDILKKYNDIELLASNEQTLRLTLENKINILNDNNNQLILENKNLINELNSDKLKIKQYDDELVHASEQLSSLSNEIMNIRVNHDKLAICEAEVSILKGDISRLIHLLDHYPIMKGFINKWNDSEGMSFTGIATIPNNQSSNQSTIHYMNSQSINTNDSNIDNMTYNDEMNEYDNDLINTKLNHMTISDLTPTELEHLKRIHGGDPFPITSTMEEEELYWVPKRAATIGMDFLSSNLPHAPPSVIMEFLRKMNKVWLKREQRKVTRLKEIYDKQIKDLKRQISNSKPYKGVINEKKIQRLQSQVKDDRRKLLQGKPKQLEQRIEDYDDDDFNEYDNLDDLPPHHRRPCMIPSKDNQIIKINNETTKTRLNNATAKKLLEASLISLETLGRQVVKSSGSNNMSLSMNLVDDNISKNNTITSIFPSESYIRGALWLGRNISMLIEDFSELLDNIRIKHLSDISSASHDTDLKRSINRLNLLAVSSINDIFARVQKIKLRAREILTGTSKLKPGDSEEFKSFLTTLPIESALTTTNLNTSRSFSPSKRNISFSNANVSTSNIF